MDTAGPPPFPAGGAHIKTGASSRGTPTKKIGSSGTALLLLLLLPPLPRAASGMKSKAGHTAQGKTAAAVPEAPPGQRQAAKAKAKARVRCAACLWEFGSTAGLVEHCVQSGHDAGRCCRGCRRLFGSEAALRDHERDVHQARRLAPAPPGPAVPRPRRAISCRGNSYSVLAAGEEAVLLEKLRLSCHAPSCLAQHGYRLGHLLPAAGSSTQGTAGQAAATPAARASRPTRQAVVVDCEMGGVRGGQSELLSVSAIDFVTGETLVSSLVEPSRPIVSWRTKCHGISAGAMATAVSKGQALGGWEAARAEVWKHIDDSTVLVGQALQMDLKVLRMVHLRVVDTALITADAVHGPGWQRKRTWGLTDLCRDLVGISIRASGNQSHDSLEDALATRELALCCLRNPAALQVWAHMQRQRQQQQQQEREMGKKKKEEGKEVEKQRQRQRQQQKIYLDGQARQDSPGSPAGSGSTGWWSRPESDGDDDEVLRWEDVVDWDTWPKSPPDWD